MVFAIVPFSAPIDDFISRLCWQLRVEQFANLAAYMTTYRESVRWWLRIKNPTYGCLAVCGILDALMCLVFERVTHWGLLWCGGNQLQLLRSGRWQWIKNSERYQWYALMLGHVRHRKFMICLCTLSVLKATGVTTTEALKQVSLFVPAQLASLCSFHVTGQLHAESYLKQ